VGELSGLRAALGAMAPGLVLFAAVLFLGLPFRLFGGFLPMPILPLLIVFLYALYDPDQLPAPLVFAAGLLHDALYGSAFGPWASVYLLLQLMVIGQRTYFLGRARDVVWLGCAVALFLVMIVLWLEMSLLAGGWLPILPAAYPFFIPALLYPIPPFLFFYLRARQGIREEWQV
jgi:rod shape-determining protein MreD